MMRLSDIAKKVARLAKKRPASMAASNRGHACIACYTDSIRWFPEIDIPEQQPLLLQRIAFYEGMKDRVLRQCREPDDGSALALTIDVASGVEE